MINKLLVVVLMSTICTCDTIFSINKIYFNTEQSTEKMGELTVFQEDTTDQAYISSSKKQLISKKDFNHCEKVILEFKSEDIVYRTVVTKPTRKKFGEKIYVMMGGKGEIVAINYGQSQIIDDIEPEIVYPERGKEHKFTIHQQEQKKQEQESFFSKYRWPLIIAGVIIYMMLTMDPEKMQQAQQGQNAPSQ